MPEQNLIQRGDLLQRLLRGLEVRGKGSLALDQVVSPIVILEDLTRGLEPDPRAPGWYYSQRMGGIAGELSIVGIVNAGPEVFTVDEVQITANVGLDFDVFTSTEAAILGATAFTEPASWADTRLAAIPPLAGTVGSAPAGVGTIENMIARTKWTAGGAPTTIRGPILIAPGKGLVVQSTAVAAVFNAGFQGRVSLP